MTKGSPFEHDELVNRISRDLADGYDEELEMEIEDRHPLPGVSSAAGTDAEKNYRRIYFQQLFRQQAELVKLQDWVVAARQKVLILFEGRDAAGKGGAIKRISQKLNPRVCRVVALPAPNDRERTQWYFQRYVTHLPAAGEIVLFDRSWYNRAGVEQVMGFCTPEEYEEFFRSVPEFERMLVRSGIKLLKYWFSITDEEQYLRFLGRIHDPLKQWKLSPMDLESRRRWEDYTKAKEVMLERSHIPEARWWVVHAVDKKRARLNFIIICCSSFPTQTRRNRWLCCRNANITSITRARRCRRTWLCRRRIERRQRMPVRREAAIEKRGASLVRAPHRPTRPLLLVEDHRIVVARAVAVRPLVPGQAASAGSRVPRVRVVLTDAALAREGWPGKTWRLRATAWIA